jgi:tetratricopeptide (TPR) repeat protein
MKLSYTFLLLLLFNFSFSQSQEEFRDYFMGEKLFCGSANNEAITCVANGLTIMHLLENNQENIEKCAALFSMGVKKDSTFCDAYFFTGYALSMLGNNKDAIVYYYMADSLSNNKSLIFKVNLAATALKAGPAGVDLARKKYEEIIKYFPYSPEGHHGYAVTSTIIGDYDKGLQQVEIAIYKYKRQHKKEPEDGILLRAVLLSLNNRHEEAIALFKKEVDDKYKEYDEYKVHYAYSLYKLSEINQDQRMKRQAFLLYNTVKDKASVPDTLDIRKLAITKPVPVQE